jgi:hypothetical protein
MFRHKSEPAHQHRWPASMFYTIHNGILEEGKQQFWLLDIPLCPRTLGLRTYKSNESHG